MAELAKSIDVALVLFSDFRADDAELPAAALDRLLVTLKMFSIRDQLLTVERQP